MKLPGAHLTYCTNVHPGESWEAVSNIVTTLVPRVKTRVAPNAPFGVGLRLSAVAAEALASPATLAEFRDRLEEQGLYVFTLNGFPYGPFHGAAVKARVYQPDWRRPERRAYSDRLAHILARLLPEDREVEGSISTVPGAFRPDAAAPEDRSAIASGLLAHAATLFRIERETGRTLRLALEPEPACLLETTAEAVTFLVEEVFARAQAFGAQLDLAPSRAEAALRRHIGLCLDACHAAVEFESPREAVALCRREGVTLAKVQLSTGLEVRRVHRDLIPRLEPYAEGVYLHQVVERERGPAGDSFRRFDDLPEALAQLRAEPERSSAERDWRIHYHVPIFHEALGDFSNTQPFLRELLELWREAPFCPHLEVETYTWDVLPAALRGDDVVADVVHELEWAREQLRRHAP